jgi:hypothetical protein
MQTHYSTHVKIMPHLQTHTYIHTYIHTYTHTWIQAHGGSLVSDSVLEGLDSDLLRASICLSSKVILYVCVYIYCVGKCVNQYVCLPR